MIANPASGVSSLFASILGQDSWQLADSNIVECFVQNNPKMISFQYKCRKVFLSNFHVILPVYL